MANNLTISYDLINPGQNYDKVIDAIKKLGNWAKIHKSYWYVKSNYTAAQAKDALLKVIDTNDTVFVVDATNGNAAWYNISKEASTYIVEQWSKALVS